jgi:hypothetical protein
VEVDADVQFNRRVMRLAISGELHKGHTRSLQAGDSGARGFITTSLRAVAMLRLARFGRQKQ